MELYLQWKMRCHNTAPPLGVHQIDIPSPRHLELRADRCELERDSLETLFVCPLCGHVSSYKGSEALCWQKPPSTGQDIPPDVYPLCIELPCAEEGCRPRTQVRTARYASETRDQAFDRLSRTDFQNVTCSKGHPLVFPDEGVGTFDDIDAQPF